MIEIFQIIVLIFSAVAHEYMHGWTAFRLGDSTAKDAGRLTLNPLAHLEWFGSIILPLSMVLTRMPFIFGWAKPVPYNPYNLRDRKYGDAKVAIAGPLTNFIIAIFFGLILRFVPGLNPDFANFLGIIVYINLILAVFNLIPLPPLDGSKVLAVFLPDNLRERLLKANQLSFILIIFLLILLGNWFLVPINFLFRIIVGGA